MRKILEALLIFSFIFVAVGCGNNDSNNGEQMSIEELLVGRWDFVEKSSEDFSTLPRFVFFPDGQWAISTRNVDERAVIVGNTLSFGADEEYIDFRYIGGILYLHYGNSRWETSARRVSSFVDQESGGFPLAGMWVPTDEDDEGFVVFFPDGASATGVYGYWQIDSIANNRLYALHEGNVVLEFYFEVTEDTLTITEIPQEYSYMVMFQRVRS